MLTILNDNKQSKPSGETALNEDKSTIKSKKNDALRLVGFYFIVFSLNLAINWKKNEWKNFIRVLQYQISHWMMF